MAPSLAHLSHFISSQFTSLPYPEQSFAGQTVIVTGANTGLGLEAAKHAARLGATKVILAVRSFEKGEKAKDSIEQSTGKEGIVEVWQVDLSSYESVKAFAKKADSLPRIDVVLENAGIVSAGWALAEGSEITMTVNVYGTFLMALLLIPILRKSAKKHNITPRITIVSSEAHHFTPLNESKSEDFLGALDDKSQFVLTERYAITKLLEIYYVRELASKIDPNKTGVVVNLINPGLCWSELDRGLNFALRAMTNFLRLLLARTTEVGGRTLVHAASSGIESHGKYSLDCRFSEEAVSRAVRNAKGQQFQKSVYDQINQRLEKIQPGIAAAALAT